MIKKIAVISTFLAFSCSLANAYYIPKGTDFEERANKLTSYTAMQDSGNGISLSHQYKFSLPEVIDQILKNNYTAAMSLYQLKMTDSDLLKYQTKFSPYFAAETSYLNQKLAPTNMAKQMGTKNKEFDWQLAAGKNLKSGTQITAGLASNVKDANDLAGDPILHSPALFINIEQQLLKNAFGINVTRTEDILKYTKESNEVSAKYNVSLILAGIINDYWNISIKYRNLCDAEIELLAYKHIREKLKENVRLGLMETYYLNQFNALVHFSNIKVDNARYEYYESMVNIKYLLGIKNNEAVIIPLSLNEKIKNYDKEKLINTALSNRADYIEAVNNLKIAELSLKNYKNESKPELVAGLSYSRLGGDKRQQDAFEDAINGNYHSTKAYLSFNYLLDNQANEVDIRDLKYKIEQAKLEIARIEDQINKELSTAIRQVKLTQSVLNQAKLAGNEVDLYIESLMKRLTQGRINTNTLKDAVDMVVQYRTVQTNMINALNLSMLNIDLVTNTLLSNNNINLNKYIPESKEAL